FNGVSPSNGPHIHVTANQSFTTSTGERIEAGTAQGPQSYLDITCTMSGSAVTCPGFQLDSTRDSPDTPTATYSFNWFRVTGSSQGYIGPIQGMSNLQVPPTIVASGACSPVGTCAFFVDLIIYNQGSPPLPISDFYNKQQIDNKLV